MGAGVGASGLAHPAKRTVNSPASLPDGPIPTACKTPTLGSRVAQFLLSREEFNLLSARKETIMSDGSTGTVVLIHGGFVDGSGWQGVPCVCCPLRRH